MQLYGGWAASTAGFVCTPEAMLIKSYKFVALGHQPHSMSRLLLDHNDVTHYSARHRLNLKNGFTETSFPWTTLECLLFWKWESPTSPRCHPANFRITTTISSIPIDSKVELEGSSCMYSTPPKNSCTPAFACLCKCFIGSKVNVSKVSCWHGLLHAAYWRPTLMIW